WRGVPAWPGCRSSFPVAALRSVAGASEFVCVARGGGQRVFGVAVDFGAHQYESGLGVVFDDGRDDAALRESGVEFLDSLVDCNVLVRVEAHLRSSPFCEWFRAADCTRNPCPRPTNFCALTVAVRARLTAAGAVSIVS